ncbi:hypothetical protein FSARC_11666 [Fusarium sarcochroum]|uniref:Uncharacterized protein n=1 Tax=Fusarium sarcochroum TaxID=1208366 RepID=A0A8H4TDX3_9HYPO|nr:hypothetical protein FSARC_11666 [Fusarium sarcochroum]
MSKLVDDVKSGLKGIRGAGDALRGEVLDATDKAFDTNPNDPSTLKTQADNRGIAEKGKRDLKGADEMFARREWENKGVNPPAHVGPRDSERVPHDTVTSHTEPLTRTAAHDRPNEGLEREPGTILPGETSHYGTGRTAEDAPRHPGTHVPGEQRFA